MDEGVAIEEEEEFGRGRLVKCVSNGGVVSSCKP